MARLPDLIVMAQQFGLELISIEDIKTYRRVTEGIDA